MKRVKQIYFLMLLGFLLINNNLQANVMPTNHVGNDIVIIENNVINDFDCINYQDNMLVVEDVFKDGKWKERWKSFWEGFLEGFKDGVGGIHNSGDHNSGLSSKDLEYLEKFASKLETKDNGLAMIYQLDQLIHDDSSVITNKQMLTVFKGDDRILSIVKKAMENSTFPKENAVKSREISKEEKIVDRKQDSDIFIDKAKSPRRFWKVLGYVAGYLLGKLIGG